MLNINKLLLKNRKQTGSVLHPASRRMTQPRKRQRQYRVLFWLSDNVFYFGPKNVLSFIVTKLFIILFDPTYLYFCKWLLESNLFFVELFVHLHFLLLP